METRTIRGRKFLLPDPDTQGLDEWEDAPSRGELLSEVIVSEADWSKLEIVEATITHSFVGRANLSETVVSDSRLTATTFRGADFASSRWRDTKIERCVFNGCNFLGTSLSLVTLDDVIFEDCRFDYASLNAVRATGAVAFVRCTMREATLSGAVLPDAVFSDCQLIDTELEKCDLRGANFEDTDLSEVQGIESLKRIKITQQQVMQLADVLVRDYEMTVVE